MQNKFSSFCTKSNNVLKVGDTKFVQKHFQITAYALRVHTCMYVCMRTSALDTSEGLNMGGGFPSRQHK